VRLRYAALVRRVKARLGLLTAALVLVGCARPPAATVRPTLAVFGLEVREVRLEPTPLARLEGHLQRLMEESDAFKVVPADEVKRALRRTRRRRGDRRCHSLRCQASLGRKRLDATRSLAVKVVRNLVGQCDVIGNVYDLKTRSVALSGRARAGCAEAEILRSLQLVACHIIGARRAGGEAGEARTAPQRDCLAHAEFLWVDDRLESWLHPPARRGRKGGRAKPVSEQRLAEQLLDLKRDYDRVARLGVPRWTVAATCRSGRLYEHFAERELATASSPPLSVRRQGRDAVARYEKEQGTVAARRVAPFLEKARELYRECLKLARKRELADDRYTEQARARLKGLESATHR